MCQNCCHAPAGGFSRREVLLTAAGAAVAAGVLPGRVTAEQVGLPEEKPEQWPRIRVAYLRPKADYWLGWPGTSWDVKGFVEKSRQQIQKYADEVKVTVTFEPEPLYDQAAVDRFIASAQTDKPDGLLVFPLHMDRWAMVQAIAKSGLPTIVYSVLGMGFTGHFAPVAKLPGVYLISSGDFSLKPARFGLKMIRTAHDIRRMKIVAIAGDKTGERKLEPLGLTLHYIPRQRFPDTLKTIGDTPDVKAVAQEYRKNAKKIVEPSEEDVINAARNYVTALQIMKEEGCQGITMDCLGLVTDRKIPCPPCMAWSKLLDVGVPAICEADVNAVMSHALCCLLLDKPGFQQDPVPETVNNTFIGAHCVSPTRLDGYDKPRAEYILRSHSESNIGVSLQVLWEAGRDVTIMQMVGPGKIILGKGKVLKNHDTPPAGGCRTSVELAIDAPADVRETKGFHQLFIAGDHMRDFQAYAQMYGLETEHI